MPMYDRKCSVCETVSLDHWEPIGAPEVKCTKEGCVGVTERVFLPKTRAIISDEIPGGIWIQHGICNEDGTPRKYYSKSEMAKEASRRGLVNHTDLPDRKAPPMIFRPPQKRFNG